MYIQLLYTIIYLLLDGFFIFISQTEILYTKSGTRNHSRRIIGEYRGMRPVCCRSTTHFEAPEHRTALVCTINSNGLVMSVRTLNYSIL